MSDILDEISEAANAQSGAEVSSNKIDLKTVTKRLSKAQREALLKSWQQEARVTGSDDEVQLYYTPFPTMSKLEELKMIELRRHGQLGIIHMLTDLGRDVARALAGVSPAEWKRQQDEAWKRQQKEWENELREEEQRVREIEKLLKDAERSGLDLTELYQTAPDPSGRYSLTSTDLLTLLKLSLRAHALGSD